MLYFLKIKKVNKKEMIISKNFKVLEHLKCGDIDLS